MIDEVNAKKDANRDIRDLILYRLFDCQSEDDYAKLFNLFDRIRITFGVTIYLAVIDEITTFMLDNSHSNNATLLLQVYKSALNSATRELIGSDRSFKNLDDHLARLKRGKFSWDFKFRPSDFSGFSGLPHKIDEIVKKFNEFLHG